MSIVPNVHRLVDETKWRKKIHVGIKNNYQSCLRTKGSTQTCLMARNIEMPNPPFLL